MTDEPYNYPSIIEPTQASVTVRRGEDPPYVLSRLRNPAPEAAALGPNVFGTGVVLDDCTLVLVYTATGQLVWVGTRSPQDTLQWRKPPEEIRGQNLTRPSCRLIFANTEDCGEFYYALTDYNIEKRQLSGDATDGDDGPLQVAMERMLIALERVQAICMLPVSRSPEDG